MTPPASILNNAMLYKDATQWLRHGVFMAITGGLLLLGLLVSLAAVGAATATGAAGALVLVNLFRALSLYMLIVAAFGYHRALGEFRSRTIEYYALSGISDTRLLHGKLLSMLAQALTGIFCLAPFMFFAYLLRGVDFLQMLGALITLALWQTPLFLLALLLAFLSARSRLLATLLTSLGGGVITLVAARVLRGLWISMMLREAHFAGVTTSLLKAVLSLDPGGLVCLFIFSIFYIVVCFLLHGACLAVLANTVRAFGLSYQYHINQSERSDAEPPDRLCKGGAHEQGTRQRMMMKSGPGLEPGRRVGIDYDYDYEHEHEHEHEIPAKAGTPKLSTSTNLFSQEGHC